MDMETPETINAFRAFWWGVLHAIGMFGVDNLTDDEKIDGAEKRAWFSAGEVIMASLLAGSIAVPAGFWFATITALPLAVIGGQSCSCRSLSSCPG
jgi:hypothetical protein